MSIGSRIKELRVKKGLTQEELAQQIGVTKGAVANYENEVSSPKIELMYKLFDALDCDANYLHQDDMKSNVYKETATPEEFDQIIKKYRALDAHGKEMVDFTLEKEWERSIAERKSEKVIILKEDNDYLVPDAANSLPNASAEDKQFDEDIMNDENF